MDRSMELGCIGVIYVSLYGNEILERESRVLRLPAVDVLCSVGPFSSVY